jgi:gas vesicle protein
MREYARYEGPGWEMERGSEQNQSSNPLGWLLLGIGVGATVALLLTPSSGRELRTAVGRGFRGTLHALNHATQRLHRRGSNVIRFSRRGSLSGT